MNDKSLLQDAENPRYWFPAKSYGWGWGFPSTWEGWVAFAIFLAICGFAKSFATVSLVKTIALISVAAVGLFAIAYWKGEPPRWRWGK